jgi:hypothetical protein
MSCTIAVFRIAFERWRDDAEERDLPRRWM